MDFNNREYAILIWATLAFFILILKTKDLRAASLSLLKAFFNKIILASLGIATLWITICIFILYKVNLWSLENIKTTIIWSVTFAFVTFFELNKMEEDNSYFKKKN